MKTIKESVLTTSHACVHDAVSTCVDNSVISYARRAARHAFFAAVNDPARNSVIVCVHYSIYKKISTT